MIIQLWGTRGSLASSAPDTVKYGGNTSCVEVKGRKQTLLVLDAGTGILRLGHALEKNQDLHRINILLTHLHLDHIQGLGFFAPLYNPNMEVHIYGPAGTPTHLHNLLSEYLSPPLFPVMLRDLPCDLYLHAVHGDTFSIDEFTIVGQFVCHPGFTLGYRIHSAEGSIAYLPDHEPALGTKKFPQAAEWTSGYDLASHVDVLIHDAQYTSEEYVNRIGWGHSSIEQAILFAKLTKVKTLVTMHHDPAHSDEELDVILKSAIANEILPFNIIPGREETIIEV